MAHWSYTPPSSKHLTLKVVTSFAALFFLFLSTGANADEPLSPLARFQKNVVAKPQTLPVSIFYKLAEHLDLPPSDQRLRALFSKEEANALLKKEQASTKLDLSEDRTVLAHIQHNKGGEEIRPFEEVIAPLRKQFEAEQPRLKKIAEKMLQDQREHFEKAFTLKPLPTCTQSKTERITLQKLPKDYQKDVLFVSPRYATTSANDLFGESVELIIYDQDAPSSFALFSSALQVPCLPYRIRVEGKLLFKHSGEKALRNFDGDPYGEGESLL